MKSAGIQSVREGSSLRCARHWSWELLAVRLCRVYFLAAVIVLGVLLSIQNCPAAFQITQLGALNGFTNGTDIVGLAQGRDGGLYGVASGNGIYEESNGTLFAMSASGSVTVLADFDPTNGYPTGPLMRAAGGSFYGVRGALVFRLTTNGELSTVTSFSNNGSNDRPYTPNGPLAQGRDGNFYGTSQYGGADQWI